MNAQEIVLSPEEQAELSRRVRSAMISQRDGRRARVVLLAAHGCSRVEIARSDWTFTAYGHQLVPAFPNPAIGRQKRDKKGETKKVTDLFSSSPKKQNPFPLLE